MRQQVNYLLFVFVGALCAPAAGSGLVDSPAIPSEFARVANVPMTFTPNRGQWPDTVSFRASAPGATIWLSPTCVTYQLTKTISGLGADTSADATLSGSHQTEVREHLMVRALFLGCNQSSVPMGDSQLSSTTNYLTGNDPSRWFVDIPNFGGVTYSNIYPGIDLRYYGTAATAEYDFIVSPQTDYSRIKISFEGIDSLSLSTSGDLLIHTRWGNLIEQAPVIHQSQAADRRAVDGRFRLLDKSTFTFDLSSSYDPALPVVIDPVLRFATYLGGGDNDYANGIAVDGHKNIYITGVTGSADFPSQNQYQTFQGVADVFVTKLDSTGAGLIYSTYIGGTHEYDEATAIAVDTAGNAYLAGYTYSDNFPTVGPFQTFQGTASRSDGFALKLNAAGNGLVYSTYLGGNNDDIARAIKCNSSGNAFIAGSTLSTNFPTLNQYQADPGDAREDAFVTKLNPSGNGLVFSTYIGGDSIDVATGLAIDPSSNVYLVGFTSSVTFPTKTPFQARQGSTDAFLLKLNSGGNTLSYSTYLGGTVADYAQAIAVDGSSCAFVAGFTRSSGFPTQSPIQLYQGAATKSDCFVLKMNAAGTALVYGTYLGGTDNDIANGIAIDGSGNAYVTGYTTSNNFPTKDPVQTYQGGATKSDAFVAKLKPAGDSLEYATYLGGSSDDYADAICVDAAQSAYIAGFTFSTNFPVLGQYQPDQLADDAFVVKIGFPAGCCVAATGNVDCDPADGVDISDLSRLIDYLYITFIPLCCAAEANVDGQPGIDISDLSSLIDYLYISFNLPAVCQ